MTNLYDTWLRHADMIDNAIYTPQLLNVVRAEGEENIDGFLSAELAIAATLGKDVARRADNVEGVIRDRMGASSDADELDLPRVEVALSEASQEMGNPYSERSDEVVRKRIENVMDGGALEMAGVAYFMSDSNIAKRSIIDGMSDAAKYYTNNYFNRIVMPELTARIERLMTDPGSANSLTMGDLRAALDDRLRSTRYWRLVANSASSRAFHYGALRGGLEAGFTGYRLVVTHDEKTSTLCRSLSGKSFSLREGAAQVERAAKASVDELSTVSPWLKYDDIKGLDASQLAEMGYCTPPFHGFCRTTVELY